MFLKTDHEDVCTMICRLLALGALLVLLPAAQADQATNTAPGGFATLARRVGVQLESGYATARAKLLATSWKADTDWGVSGVNKQLAYRQYPEVLCGEGYDAACTGRFVKSGQAILLSIDQKSKALRVFSVDED
jgi:hypothetical protein